MALYVLLSGLDLFLFGVTLLGLAFLGTWVSDEAERVFGREDDGRIVIDEVVGQLLTLAPLLSLPASAGRRSPLWLLAGFAVFRLLDIWKPGPVVWAERRFRGGAAVMMDDVVAGILGCFGMSAAVLWVGP